MNRRDFLKGTAWSGAAALLAGCQVTRLGFGAGGTMQNFALQPFKRLRVGFVGLGHRGAPAVRRVSSLPGVDVVALCDLKAEPVDALVKWLAEQKRDSAGIRRYVGPDAYCNLCDFGDCDVIYCATPWHLHHPVARRALLGGKIALVEVPAALTVDECWELVETSEKCRLPCMQLENCVYGEIELLELNLARLGLLGEINHAEGAYIHDLRGMVLTEEMGGSFWRYEEDRVHKGNRYPTHGLVPICQTLGINRGDRFDYLVSLENGPHNANYEYLKRTIMPEEDPHKHQAPAAMGDVNTTLIKTVKGKSILVQHDVSSPRPYSRMSLLSGTKGIVADYPFRCAFESVPLDGQAEAWWDEKRSAEVREKYMHPLWRSVADIAKKIGGHGGMDYIMDLRWAWCLQNGQPLDMDVYDLAASCCLCELTERSVRASSQAVSVPDFTRGNWRHVEPWGIVQPPCQSAGTGARERLGDVGRRSV